MGKHAEKSTGQGEGQREETDANGRACPSNDVIRSRMRELRGQPLDKIMKVLEEMCHLPLATYIIQLLVDELGHKQTGEILEEQKKQQKEEKKEEKQEQTATKQPEPEPAPKEKKQPKRIHKPKKGDKGSIAQMSVKVHKAPKYIGTTTGELSRGDQYEVLETKGDWSRIQSGDIEGWIPNATIMEGQRESPVLTTEPGTDNPNSGEIDGTAGRG